MKHKFLEPMILSYGLSLKFLRGFVDFSETHVISGYTRMSTLVLVFLFNSNYLLAYTPQLSACRPSVPITIVC